jgi:hypothetical protein
MTESSSGIFARSLVKTVIIGDVPDRGGRATSARAKITAEKSEKKWGHKNKKQETITKREDASLKAIPDGNAVDVNITNVSYEDIGSVPMEVETNVVSHVDVNVRDEDDSPRGKKREGDHIKAAAAGYEGKTYKKKY